MIDRQLPGEALKQARIAWARHFGRNTDRAYPSQGEFAAFDAGFDAALLAAQPSADARDPWPDTEADGVVFCGKCGSKR